MRHELRSTLIGQLSTLNENTCENPTRYRLGNVLYAGILALTIDITKLEWEELKEIGRDLECIHDTTKDFVTRRRTEFLIQKINAALKTVLTTDLEPTLPD